MAPSVFTSSEKSLIKSLFPSSSYKIITVSPVRIYAAFPTPDKWYYTGVEGALAFVRDTSNVFHFKVVDLKSKGQIVWDHELYEDFYFYEDKPYFHTFAGDKCMLGLCYADESGAVQMYKKVSNRAKYAKSSSSSSGFSFAKKISSLIGSSSTSSDDKRVSSSKAQLTDDTQAEPQWNGLVDQLGSMGVSEVDIKNNEGFLRDFLGRGSQKLVHDSHQTDNKLPPPTTSLMSTRNAPPPAPPAISALPVPLSVPSLPSRGVDSTSTPQSAPPVSRHSLPPPPPARPGVGSSASPRPPPPPLPPHPVSGRAPPPVPSRPVVGGRGPPPPPPPPPMRPDPTRMSVPGLPAAPPAPPGPPAPSGSSSMSGLPPPQPGRDALLASIQGKSVKDLKKTDPNAPPPRSSGGTGGSASSLSAAAGMSGGENDLESALSTALNKRKGNMGGSDEEESDDDW